MIEAEIDNGVLSKKKYCFIIVIDLKSKEDMMHNLF